MKKIDDYRPCKKVKDYMVICKRKCKKCMFEKFIKKELEKYE